MDPSAVAPPPPKGFIPIEQYQKSQGNAIPPPPPGFVPIEQASAAKPEVSYAQPPSVATTPAKPGMLSRGMDAITQGVVSPQTVQRALVGPAGVDIDKSIKDAQEEQLEGAANGVEPGILSRGRLFGLNVAKSASNAVSGLTSPAAIASTVSGLAGKASGILFGAKGATDLVKDPEQLESVGRLGLSALRLAVPGAELVTDDPLDRVNPDKLEAGLMNAANVAGGAAATGAAVKGFKAGPGMFSKKMAEKPYGEQFTRQQQADAAEQHGVNLDVADATGAGGPKVAKKFLERSMGGSGTFEKNTDTNLHALDQWANGELDNYNPQGQTKESLGAKMQQGLQNDYHAQKNSARQEFSSLDKAVGPNSIDVSKGTQAEARAIYDENKSYYQKHPEFIPKEAWNIVKDLAGVDKDGNLATGPRMESWEHLHNLRSDTMEAYRNSPDLTKSKAEGWVQRLTGAIDNDMTSASSGLTPQQKVQFRGANDTWEQMKSTYDNPQHPFYHAVRSQFPSKVPDMLGQKTPELARQVQQTLGGLKGSIQRQFVSDLLDPNGDGQFDFKGLNARVGKLPDEYLNSVLGANGTKNVKLLARVSKTVTDNTNPSGTGAVNVAAGDVRNAARGVVEGGAALASAGLAPIAEYAGAKAMTRPGMLSRVTRTGQPGIAAQATAQGKSAGVVSATAQGDDQRVPDGYTRVRSHIRKIAKN